MSEIKPLVVGDLARLFFSLPQKEQTEALWSVDGDEFKTLEQLKRGSSLTQDRAHRLQCLRAIAFEADFRR